MVILVHFATCDDENTSWDTMLYCTAWWKWAARVHKMAPVLSLFWYKERIRESLMLRQKSNMFNSISSIEISHMVIIWFHYIINANILFVRIFFVSCSVKRFPILWNFCLWFKTLVFWSLYVRGCLTLCWPYTTRLWENFRKCFKTLKYDTSFWFSVFAVLK